jgi:HEAT repeat protein
MTRPTIPPDNASVSHAQIAKLLSDFHNIDSRVAKKALKTLSALDRQGTMNILVEFLHDKTDSSLRCDSAEAILLLDPNTVELVTPLLTDPLPSVRWNICGLMHDLGDHRATDGLVRVLTEDESGDNRYIAAWALGAVGAPSALPALQHAAASDDGTDREGRPVRDAALEAIDLILSRK